MRKVRLRVVKYEEGVKSRIVGLADAFVRGAMVYGAENIPLQEFSFVQKALAHYLHRPTASVKDLVDCLKTSGLFVPEAQKRQQTFERQRQVIERRMPDYRQKSLLGPNRIPDRKNGRNSQDPNRW